MTTMAPERPPKMPAPDAPERSRWRRRPPLQYLFLGIAALIVAYLALVPLGTMVVASFRTTFLGITPGTWTFQNYVSTLRSSGFGSLVSNTLIFSISNTIVCTFVGFVLAWLVTSTNMPLKGIAGTSAIIPLIIPGILSTIGWALLLAPRTGPANSVLRSIGLPAFNVYSMGGMVFVQAIHTIPLAYLMGVAAFHSKDSAFEHAALASGVSPVRVFFKITIRMARPAILAVALLMFVQGISTFEVPQLIGVPARRFVFVSKIYSALQKYPPDYGTVGVLGMLIVVVAAVGLWGSRRLSGGTGTQTITGKAFRPTLTELGRWRWVALGATVIFFLLAVVLPLAMLVWSSLLPGYQPPSFAALHKITLNNYRAIFRVGNLSRAVRNSLITAVASGAVVTALAALIAYITVKTKLRGRAALDTLATVPIAVPSIIVGVGILYWYLAVPLPIHVYGTLIILIIAFVTIGLPYALRFLTPGMAQISDELEQAATISGASWAQTFRRVFLPLLVPSLVGSFLYTMIIAFREISAAIFLYGSGTQVVSVTVYTYWSDGAYPTVAALGVLMVAFMLAMAIIVRLATRRLGIRNY